MADPVRPLVVIAAGQAIAALVLTVAVAVSAIQVATAAVATLEITMWALVVAALALIWLGLYRRRRIALTPFVLAQAFALVVAWPLVRSDAWWYVLAGATLGACALVGLVQGLRSATRQSLH